MINKMGPDRSLRLQSAHNLSLSAQHSLVPVGALWRLTFTWSGLNAHAHIPRGQRRLDLWLIG